MTKLKIKLVFGLVISLFFTLYLIYLNDGDFFIILKSLLLGLVISFLFSIYNRKWLLKNIKGTILFINKHKSRRTLLKKIIFVVIIAIPLYIVTRQGYRWPIIGLGMSWIFSIIFNLFYIIRLEKKLGGPILLENEKRPIKWMIKHKSSISDAETAKIAFNLSSCYSDVYKFPQ